MVFVALSLLFTGCSSPKTRVQACKYHQNARKKAVVAILPVVCKVTHYLPWDLSMELTAEVQRRLISHSIVFVNSIDTPPTMRDKLYQNDLVHLWAKDFQELAGQNDFVVLMELIDHSEQPYNFAFAHEASDRNIDRMLTIKMRVKVLDLRSKEDKAVLQEIVEVSHLIPRETSGMDYQTVIYGSDAYPATAYGRAHARIEKDLARQIENYISIVY